MQSRSRLQKPLFVHHAIDNVRVDLVEHGAVVLVRARKAILCDHLLETFLVQLANRGHLHLVGEAMDRWVVGALAAPPRADKSCFKHDLPLSGTKP